MSAEPEDGEVPLETYGGQPPEHTDVFDAPDLSPNAPIPDANAIPGIDEDPAPVDPSSGLPPVIAVSETIATASDMHAVPSASLPVTLLVAAPVSLVAASPAATNLVEPMSEFERGRLAGLAAATATVLPVSSQPSSVARVTS